MLRLGAYGRVSTEEQDTIAAQLAACSQLATRLGGAIIATEHDKISGLDSRRPGYQRLLEKARRGELDGVLVWKLDRFGRDHVESIRAVNELERLGCAVYSATEQLQDPFVRDLMLLIANRDSRVTSERVRLQMRAEAAAGKWQGAAPPGYRVSKDAGVPRLALDPEKAPLVRRLFEIAVEGKWSLRSVRDAAHALGLTSSRGHALSRTHVHKLLTNPVYVGDVVYGRRPHGRFVAGHNAPREDWTIAQDAHPAIIDRATFARVQAALASHKRFPARTRGSRFFLTGLVYCAECDGRMYGSAGRGDNFVYTCGKAAGYGLCMTGMVGGKGIDSQVRAALRAIRVTPEIRANAEAMVREAEAVREKEAQAQRRNLLRRRQAIEDSRLNRARDVLSRIISPDVYSRIEVEDLTALRIIDRELATLEETQPLDITAELAFLERVNWDDFDEEAWQQAAALFIQRVVVQKGERKGDNYARLLWTEAARAIIAAVSQPV